MNDDFRFLADAQALSENTAWKRFLAHIQDLKDSEERMTFEHLKKTHRDKAMMLRELLKWPEKEIKAATDRTQRPGKVVNMGS